MWQAAAMVTQHAGNAAGNQQSRQGLTDTTTSHQRLALHELRHLDVLRIRNEKRNEPPWRFWVACASTSVVAAARSSIRRTGCRSSSRRQATPHGQCDGRCELQNSRRLVITHLVHTQLAEGCLQHLVVADHLVLALCVKVHLRGQITAHHPCDCDVDCRCSHQWSPGTDDCSRCLPLADEQTKETGASHAA